ncbi:pro-sigmaK processing inhibitor BofA family protein [Phascolarctobacterium succinatutens]
MEFNAILTPLGALGPMIGGVLLLLLVVKLLSMPFKLVWNGFCGALLLWFINLVGSLAGFTMKITVMKALIAGFFGVPGALAVVLYELLVK